MTKQYKSDALAEANEWLRWWAIFLGFRAHARFRDRVSTLNRIPGRFRIWGANLRQICFFYMDRKYCICNCGQVIGVTGK